MKQSADYQANWCGVNMHVSCVQSTTYSVFLRNKRRPSNQHLISRSSKISCADYYRTSLTSASSSGSQAKNTVIWFLVIFSTVCVWQKTTYAAYSILNWTGVITMYSYIGKIYVAKRYLKNVPACFTIILWLIKNKCSLRYADDVIKTIYSNWIYLSGKPTDYLSISSTCLYIALPCHQCTHADGPILFYGH